jgi:hypothetical protein
MSRKIIHPHHYLLISCCSLSMAFAYALLGQWRPAIIQVCTALGLVLFLAFCSSRESRRGR